MVQHEQDGGSTGASSGMGSGDAANTTNLPDPGRTPAGQADGDLDKGQSGGASSGMTGEKEYDTSAAGTSAKDEGPSGSDGDPG